jgi:hypothetical protein
VVPGLGLGKGEYVGERDTGGDFGRQ